MTVSYRYPDEALTVMANGRAVTEKYHIVLQPEVEARLKRHDKMRFLYVIGEDFESFSPREMVLDADFGCGHLGRLDCCALVTNLAWIADGARQFAPCFHLPFLVFSGTGIDAARTWVLDWADNA